jgi:hypothetical protein
VLINVTDEDKKAYERYKQLKKRSGFRRLDDEERVLYREKKYIRQMESDYPENFLDFMSIPAIEQGEKDLEQYHEILSTAKDEKPLQDFFQSNPYFIGSLLKGTQFGHHGAYCFSQFHLADKYRPDFAICGFNSEGSNWIFIELQSPNGAIILKNGQPAAQAREGLYQIKCWKEWFRENINFARSQLKVKIPDLHQSRIHYYLIIGRRQNFGVDENNWRAMEVLENTNVQIISYDRIANFYYDLINSNAF